MGEANGEAEHKLSSGSVGNSQDLIPCHGHHTMSVTTCSWYMSCFIHNLPPVVLFLLSTLKHIRHHMSSL